MQLPALPEVLLKLLELFRRDDAGMLEFAELIAADPAMAGKVLAAANSAAHHGRGPVRDLQRCLETLGTETVRTIVIGQAVFQALHSLPLLRRAELGPFWRHSLLAAAVAREVARRSKGVSEDEAYLAGLLHDIGRLGLLAAAPEFFAEGLSSDDSPAQCLTERRWLKVDHAEAGAWLIERWRLSRTLADSVRYHHEPLKRLADTETLIRIVALAHLVAEPTPDAKLVAEAAALCDMGLDEVSELVARANSRLGVTAEQLGIRLDDTGTPVRSSAAAEKLEDEIPPLMMAATVLAAQPVPAKGSRYLSELAATTRLVFQFSEVVPMLCDEQRRLRWAGAGEASADAAVPHSWLEFSLPAEAGTRIGDALAQRRPLVIDRAKDGPEVLSIAEDQLLRNLSTEQLVCLPVRLAAKGEKAASLGALVCVGDAALIAELSAKQAFLSAFVSRAEASQGRADRQQVDAERVLEEQAARQLTAAKDLAHEINNPLTIIQNYLGVLDVKLGTSDALSADERQDLSGDIAVLQQEVARVGRLVQTLAAAKPGIAHGAVDLNRLITDVVRLFKTQAAEFGIEISGNSHQAAEQPLVERDALEQVLVNLVKNAVEAMSTPDAVVDARPEGAQIIVRNNGLVNRDGRLLLELSVRDNGPGIPAAKLSRVFAEADEVAADVAAAERRSAEMGSDRANRGRGLRIVQTLVNKMGGAIQCRSSGFGTTFDIFLPCRQTAESEPPEPGTP